VLMPISQSRKIFLRGFMAKIGAHKNETSNLLKLKCKINNGLVCYVRFNSNKFIHASQMTKRLRIKIELVADPIMMHLAQGIAKSSINIAVGVNLFCKGVIF
jgi:hypothetical protein